MATERTPEENRDNEADRRRVEAVIRQARTDLVSWQVAEQLDEPAEVCERWVNRIWDGLRDGLSPEDRVLAIVSLIEVSASEEADRLVRAVRS